MDGKSFAARYDKVIGADWMRAIYGDSGYFNTGYWEPGIADIVQACDRLVDELASVVPADASLIVDVGCGVGAATRRLAERFPDATLLAVNISHAQLRQARPRGVAPRRVRGAAPRATAARRVVASGTVDAVIALESPQHFETRADFLSEAHRVLRPGGILSLSDMLFTAREPASAWMLPAANAIATVAQYEEALARAGF